MSPAVIRQQLRRLQSECDALEALVSELLMEREQRQETEPDPETQEETTEEQYYKLEDIVRITQSSEATIYRWIREHRFPEGKLLGPRSRRWSRREVEQWKKRM